MGKLRFSGLHNIYLIIQMIIFFLLLLFFQCNLTTYVKLNDWSHTLQEKIDGEWMAPTVEALHGTKCYRKGHILLQCIRITVPHSAAALVITFLLTM